MRPPQRVLSNRDVNLADLPFEALDNIFFHIKNIRERFRLMRVCKRFQDVIPMHLYRVRYRILDRNQYLYQREDEQRYLDYRPLNLTRLLRLAPRLTHFDVDMEHVSFDETRKRLSLRYIRVLKLNHCRAYFNTDQGSYYIIRIDMFLSKTPRLQTLHVTVDRIMDFVLPRTELLTTFLFNYSLDDTYFGHMRRASKFKRINSTTIEGSNTSKAPISFYGIIDGSAPNLQELRIILKWMDAHLQLNDILRRVTRNCRYLDFLSINFEKCVWQMELRRMRGHYGYGPWHLPRLRVIEILGLVIPLAAWQSIFSACPNLCCCILENDSDPAVWRIAERYNIYMVGKDSPKFYI